MAKSLSSKSDSKFGMGCLMLFALPFAAVGAFFAYQIAVTLWDWQRIQAWDESAAKILTVNLVESRGDDSTTYRVTARYEYYYGDEKFVGTRVSLSSGSDNIGSFHQDVYRELNSYRRSGSSFSCFVNPDNPSEAILYRDLRWGLFGFKSLFILLFGGVGFGLILGSRFAKKKVDEEQQLKDRHPDEPWRWKQEWIDGRITGGSKAAMVTATVFALFWNLISAPVLFLVPKEVMEKGNNLALLGLLFPVVGVGLAVWAVRAIIRWRKQGRSVFEMSTVPGVAGGELRGVIHTGANVVPDKGFQLTLNCIRKTTSGSGDDRSTSESILWQDRKFIERDRVSHVRSGTEVPVLFSIPYDVRQTDDDNSNNVIFWRLDVDAVVPGVDYHCPFIVPVFKTAASDPASKSSFVPGEFNRSEDQPEFDPEKELPAAGVKVGSLPEGGRSLVFGMARHKGAALGVTMFCALWAGAIALQIHLGAPMFFPIVFGVFGLLISYFALDLWLARTRIDLLVDSLRFYGGWFVMGKPRSFARNQIREANSKKGMRSGSRLYYDVEVTPIHGRKFSAARYLDDRRVAEYIAAQIRGV